MVLELIKNIFEDDIFSINSKVFGSKFSFRILLRIKTMLFGVCPFHDLLVVDIKVLKALHMTAGKTELTTFF